MCRLHKAIYGLKQAPRAWFNTLTATLLKLGFVASKADTSLFTRFTTMSTTYLLVYVDDIIITNSNDKELQHLIHSLNRSFSLKDLSALSYFLGIEVQYAPEGIHLSQKRYVTELLQRTKMLESNPLPTSMLSNLKLTRFD